MTRRPGAALEELRRANLSAVLTRVHASGPTSRAALTAELGLNRSTIGDLSAQLDVLGLVTQTRPTGARPAGRPSHLLVPRGDVTVLAVALEVERTVSALIGLGGVVLQRRVYPHPAGGDPVEAVAARIGRQVHDLLSLPQAARCLAVGVSVPGVVGADDGLVRFAPNLGWVDAPLRDLLRDQVPLPLRIGNDCDLGVFAEHLRGVAVGADDVAYIAGGVGVGGGFLVGGRPLRGRDGYAGEIGHLMVDPAGARCRCGAVGCWETKVGENHLLTAVGRLPGGGPPAVAEVIRAAVAGDRRAAAALGKAARWTGVGLRGVVNLFNPEVIVLGGVLGQLLQAQAEPILASMAEGGPQALREGVRVVAAGLGEDSALVGAAELGFESLLRDPLQVVGT